MRLYLTNVILDRDKRHVPKNRNGAGRPKGSREDSDALYGQTHVPGMAAHHWWILSLMLRGQSLSEIAVLTKITHPKLTCIVKRPVFKEQLEIQTRLMVEKITNGEYGVSAIARANSPQAMKKIVRLSQQDSDNRTSLQASKDVLNYAGFQPPKRIEVSVDKIIESDEMTVEELVHFAKYVELPDRYQNQVKRLNAPSDSVDNNRLANAKRVSFNED